MHKLLASLALALGLVGAASLNASDGAPDRSRCITPEMDVRLPRESHKLEAQGVLSKSTDLLGQPTWQITAGGQSFRLELGTNKWMQRLAAALEGKVVRVSGHYAHRLEYPAMAMDLPYGGKRRLPTPMHYEAIVVDDLDRASGAKAESYVEVEVRGHLNFRENVGLPPEKLAVLTAEGQRFVLSLDSAAIRHLARRLDGQNVILKGRIERWHQVANFTCDPIQLNPWQLPEIAVLHLCAAEGTSAIEICLVDVKGSLDAPLYLLERRWDMSPLSGLEVKIGDKSYALEFEGNEELRAKAGGLIGRTVRIKGSLEERTYCLGLLPGKDGSVLEIARLLKMSVIVVDSIEAVKIDSFKEVKKVHLRGTLNWHGNRKGPKGESTTMYFPWEGYTVEVDGKTYRLDFSSYRTGHNLDALVGRTVVLEGRFEMRVERDLTATGTLQPYGVIVVTWLSSAK